MRTPTLESLLLGSTDPDRLRAWYVAAFDVHPDPAGFLPFGPVGVLIDKRDDLSARAAEPGRVILNYHLADIRGAARRLDALGVEWVSPVEYRADGAAWFGTVRDPDGNYVQLIELTPQYWVRRRERAGGRSGPLSAARAATRLPAQDLDRARRWYAEKLGLEPAETRDGGLSYECGGTTFAVFASTGRAAGTHTQIGFTVPDIVATAADLQARGVSLLGDGIVEVSGHYPSSGATGERAIWFHDSEGNLLGVGQLVYE